MTAAARTPDGVDLEWTAEGDGPPLLLISGQSSSFDGWESVVPLLAARHRVIRYNHRGVGASGVGDPTGYSTRLFALDAAAVLDAAGVESAAVCGHSMGGRVAQWLAIDAPARVSRLVLVSTTGGDARGAKRDAEASALLVSGDRARMRPLFFGDDFAAEHPEVVDQFFRGPRDRAVLRGHFAASKEHDVWDELPRIAAPTLVVHGALDRLAPVENARRLAETIPDAALHIEPQGLHAPHLENDSTQRAIEEFVS